MNQYANIKLVINVSGNKRFPFVVYLASGAGVLGYFKNSDDAAKYCATDGQAFV